MSNDWIDQISQQMEHHEVDAPEGLWEVIESKLASSKPVRRAKLVWAWRAGAVAASVAGVVAGVQLWQNRDSSQLTEVEQPFAIKPAPSRDEQILTYASGAASPVSFVKNREKTPPLQQDAEGAMSASEYDTEAIPFGQGEDRNLVAEETLEKAVEEASAKTVERAAEKASAKTTERAAEEMHEELPLLAETAAAADDDKAYFVVRNKNSQGGVVPAGHRRKVGRVSVQLLAATSANLPSADYDSDLLSMGGLPGIGNNSLNTSDRIPADSIVVSSPPCLAVRRGGMREVQTSPLYSNHRFPVKVGFAVRIPVTRIFAIDCGLNYTRLHSSLTFFAPDWHRGQQYVNYLGVPVSLVANILDSRWWNIYAAAGGEVAKSVRTTWQDDDGNTCRASANPWQTSISAAVGMQLNLSKHVGLYVQPSLDCYFDNHSLVQTYYNEHPFTPAMRVGLRVKL